MSSIGRCFEEEALLSPVPVTNSTKAATLQDDRVSARNLKSGEVDADDVPHGRRPNQIIGSAPA
jgi:hypothetical protein